METKREVFSGSEFPTTTHQSVVGWLYTEIAVYLRHKETDCRVIASPFAVFLGEEEDSYLKPDITVAGDGGRLDDEGFHGAPDWVTEVVSPDSRIFDYGRKLAAYIDAGVREYWIVDPEKQVIVVYYLEHPDAPVICRFGDVVKSGIYHGLEIDTSPLRNIRYEEKNAAGFPESSRFGKTDGGQSGGRKDNGTPGFFRGEGGFGGGDAEKDPEREKPAYGHQARNGGKIMSVEEVKAYMEENFAELVSARNKGQLMKAAVGTLKEMAESKTINEAVAELLI